MSLETPWKRGLERRAPTHKQPYQIQEEKMALRPGARKQPNSGRLWSARGDVVQKFSSVLTSLLIDNKTTEGESYTITRRDWLRWRKTANTTPPGCRPGLQIDIQDISIIAIDLALWDSVVERILYLEERLGDDS